MGPSSTSSVLEETSKQNESTSSNATEVQQAPNGNIGNTTQPLQRGEAQTTQKLKETEDDASNAVAKNGILFIALYKLSYVQSYYTLHHRK